MHWQIGCLVLVIDIFYRASGPTLLHRQNTESVDQGQNDALLAQALRNAVIIDEGGVAFFIDQILGLNLDTPDARRVWLHSILKIKLKHPNETSSEPRHAEVHSTSTDHDDLADHDHDHGHDEEYDEEHGVDRKSIHSSSSFTEHYSSSSTEHYSSSPDPNDNSTEDPPKQEKLEKRDTYSHDKKQTSDKHGDIEPPAEGVYHGKEKIPRGTKG